ncbi:MAG: GGDEF domain-containing protein, partial [Clostridia bacterium]|nr:GGDEF domain-containing protein [Clostridia bacterium]
SVVRGDDIPARYGGEEFVALLWDVTEEQALKVAERIRDSICNYPFPQHEYQPNGRVTVSIGVALTPAESPSALLQRADEALYRAKAAGKNRVMN